MNVQELLTGRRDPIPYDSIAMYDSRLWSPEWKAQGYTRSHRGLTRILSAWLGDEGKAATLASGVTYQWDRSRKWQNFTGLIRYVDMPFERVRAFVNDVVRGTFTPKRLIRNFQQTLDTITEEIAATSTTPGETVRLSV